MIIFLKLVLLGVVFAAGWMVGDSMGFHRGWAAAWIKAKENKKTTDNKDGQK